MRMLRVLTETPEPHGAGEIARRAQLTAAGVRRSLSDLVRAGIVNPVGVGPRKLYHIRSEHPLAGTLAGLFAAERDRVDAVFEGIRTVVGALRPAPLAAWIQGSVASEEDRSGEPIVVGVLVASDGLPNPSRAIKAALEDVETGADVAIEVVRWTPAELDTATPDEGRVLAAATPLLGPPPSRFLPAATGADTRRSQKHAESYQDARALALAAAIAEKLQHDPTLLDRARKQLARRLRTASPQQAVELVEWDHLLTTTSVPRLRRLLVDPGPRATRLRQSLPFLDMLTTQERDAALVG